MELKNSTLLVFYLVIGVDVVSIVVSIPSDPRSSGDLDTLRRRSYKAVYYY